MTICQQFQQHWTSPLQSC